MELDRLFFYKNWALLGVSGVLDMSRGPKNVKTTTTQSPPGFLLGPMQAAASGALDQFNSGGGINPFNSLDMQFDRAADLTQTRLASEFAGAGRNQVAALPARSDELQTLASNIYNPSNLLQFDPLNQLISRISGLAPGAGGTTQSKQPVFRSGIF
ncbi:MAG: hypothetical protein HC808_10105 [Candidatus Competibacteraceae bacterium]|nr:hypothetical protein [Candidatus Competibacteraceae bacterium]